MEASRQPLTILVAVLLASIAPGAAAAVFNEGADFSNLGATPTLLGDFAPGSHSVSGQLGASDNNDFFSFNVDGLLEAITLSGWSGAGNTFIGLYAQDFAPPGGQIGDGFFNSGNLGASPFNSFDPFSSGALAGVTGERDLGRPLDAPQGGHIGTDVAQVAGAQVRAYHRGQGGRLDAERPELGL